MKAIAKMLALAVIPGLLIIPASVATTAPSAEDQSHMQQALDALRQAKRHLEEAIPDKHGYRSAAIKAVDEAIKHTQQGIEYANKH
jgi:hypothetical protein